MTNDEIKKGLRLCAVDCCEHCPYDDKGGYCCGKLKRDALDLLNNQEKENDLLKMQLQYAVNHANIFLEEANKFEAENEKLKAEIKQLKAKNKVFGDGVAKAFANGVIDGRKGVEKDIRRAKIDVLNDTKERCDFVAESLEDECDHYGSSAAYDFDSFFNRLEECKNNEVYNGKM